MESGAGGELSGFDRGKTFRGQENPAFSVDGGEGELAGLTKTGLVGQRNPVNRRLMTGHAPVFGTKGDRNGLDFRWRKSAERDVDHAAIAVSVAAGEFLCVRSQLSANAVVGVSRCEEFF